MRPSRHHLTCCAPLPAALVDLNERALALRTGGMRDEEDGASGPYGEPGMGGGRVMPSLPLSICCQSLSQSLFVSAASAPGVSWYLTVTGLQHRALMQTDSQTASADRTGPAMNSGITCSCAGSRPGPRQGTRPPAAAGRPRRRARRQGRTRRPQRRPFHGQLRLRERLPAGVGLRSGGTRHDPARWRRRPAQAVKGLVLRREDAQDETTAHFGGCIHCIQQRDWLV